MKIFDVDQLLQADKITIEKERITSEALMERAATKVFNEIHQRLKGAVLSIKIFCGVGNNGGDGLVIARLLLEFGYKVTVYVVNYSENRSGDFLKNYEKLKQVSKPWPILLTENEDLPELNEQEFVVDAIFGIGLNRPLEEWVGKLVKHINSSEALILSVDMPSGLFSDKIPSEGEAVINADFTLTFQAPKLIFFLPEAAEYVGELGVLDIGLDSDFLKQAHFVAKLIDKKEASSMFVPRKKYSHKGNYGHALIIGGSYGKIGSISLTATAALRTGAGLVSIYSPKCGYQILQTLLPEAMLITDEAENELQDIKFEIEPDVICFGMGAGTSSKTIDAFKSLLKRTKNPMVIDADGLNMLSKEKDLIKLVPENSVLTPHPKELERLIGKWDDDFQKLEMAKDFSRTNKVILVIKGAHTITIFRDNLYINTTGNPGMATAGAGDVLTGVITSLMSQKYDPLISAVFGVYLHGSAGDLAADALSFQGMIAGDIASNIGAAFLGLFQND